MRRTLLPITLLACLWALPSEAAPVVEGALVGALPAALPTGLSLGLGAGTLTRGTLAWGARASWSMATEFNKSWAVTHHETRLRAVVAAQRSLGRGEVGLRLAPGLSFVHEQADRAQSTRLTDSGLPLSASQWAVLPALDVEAAVVLRVAGDFGVVVTAGPTFHLTDGAWKAGWTGSLGVAWWP